MQAGEKARLLYIIESLNYRLADGEDEYNKLKNQLEQEQEEKENYKAACSKLEGMLDDANAATDELQVKVDTEREVKYVGIIFMHCDTLWASCMLCHHITGYLEPTMEYEVQLCCVIVVVYDLEE